MRACRPAVYKLVYSEKESKQRSMFYHAVAVSNNGVIGIKSAKAHPWLWTESRAHYLQIMTAQSPLIMSWKAHMAIGYRYRTNMSIMVSHAGISLSGAMSAFQDEPHVFICGGYSLFEQTMEMIDGIYMVKFSQDIEGDIFYPAIPKQMKLQRVTPMDPSSEVSLLYYQRQWQYD